MARRGVLRTVKGGSVMFWCEACGYPHQVGVSAAAGPCWQFNGDYDRPTFNPSVLVLTGREVSPSHKPEPGEPPERCHSFVLDGTIEYLGDCTHALAGHTIPLKPFPQEH